MILYRKFKDRIERNSFAGTGGWIIGGAKGYVGPPLSNYWGACPPPPPAPPPPLPTPMELPHQLMSGRVRFERERFAVCNVTFETS